MLAGDPIEAAEQAHDFLKDSSLDDYCDTILLEGLRLAEADRRLGHLDEERLNRIVLTVDELVADLEAHHDMGMTDHPSIDMSASPGAALAIEQARAERRLAEERRDRRVRCSAFRDSGKLDEAAALVLAYLLRHHGIGAMAEKADALSMSKFFSLDMTDTSLACVCYVGQPSIAKIGDVVRRLGKKNADARILVALLGAETATPATRVVGAEASRGSFAATLEAIIQATAKQRDDATADTMEPGISTSLS